MQVILDKNLSKFKKILPYILVVTLVAIPLFNNLDTLAIRVWDEARNASNACEMYKNKNWVVTYYEGTPDLWNTKPPLLIWLQVLFMKLIGLGELAVRLPSAIAGFFTCMVLLIFSEKYLKNFLIGFAAIMVFICCDGYTDGHLARTGDYDSLLIFFTTLASLLFFVYLETKQNMYLYFFFLVISLGVLTKSVSALLFSPAFLLYTLWQRQFINLLKNKHFYSSFSIFLIVVLGYYFLREHYNPGYLHAVQINELGGRYLSTIENHKESFWFYYNNFIEHRIVSWYYFIPAGFAVGILSTNEKIRKLTVFSTLLIIVHFLIISTAKTKLFWYDAPIFPFIGIIAAALIDVVFKSLNEMDYLKNNLKYNVFPYIFLFIILIGPYQRIVKKTYESNENPWDVEANRIGYYLKDAVKNPRLVQNYTLLHEGFKPAQLILYEKMLQEKSVNFALKNYNNATVGDCVIVSEQHIKDEITNKFEVKIIEMYYNITKYKIIGLKKIS